MRLSTVLNLSVACCALNVLGLAGPADAALMVITPVGGGVASGSAGYQYVTQAIDQQPTWDSTLGAPTTDPVSTYGYFGGASGNTGYFDFGANFANLRIHQVWTRYPASASRNNETPPELMWWDDDTDATNDGTTETVLTFLTPGTGSTSEQVWIQDVDTGAAPVTPQGRYLLFRAPASASSQGNELAFVGEVVPEPASLALLAVGGAAMLPRRGREGRSRA